MGGNRHKEESAPVVLERGARRTLRGRRRKPPRARSAGSLGLDSGRRALPTTVRDSNFNPDRLLTLRTRNSAAYKGIYALLIQNGGREFLTDEPISLHTYEEEKIDIHHIFPQKWCKDNEIERKRMDCIVNKAAISSRTNRIIGGVAPSKYLKSLDKRGGIGASKMDQILATHLIAAEALRADNFEAFFEARRHGLLDLIGEAMGKSPVAAADPSEPTGEPIDDEDDTDDDAETIEFTEDAKAMPNSQD